MTHELAILPSARREWDGLGATLKAQFRKKLAERLEAPRVSADALRGMPDHYRIELRAAGCRLVYRVEDETVTLIVVAVGKRERNAVHRMAARRRLDG
jgi:mRNA interferase RelE/StbE